MKKRDLNQEKSNEDQSGVDNVQSERVLIQERTFEMQGDIDHVQIVCLPAVRNIIKRFKKLNLGEMSTELLHDALFNNSAEIINMFRQQAQEDVANLKNPVLIRNLYDGMEEAIVEFRLDVNSMAGMCNRDLLRLVSIEENEPVVTDENLEKLKERHRTYVSAKEAELFELHKKIANDINTLFEGNEEASLYGVSYIARFFTCQEGKFIARPGINYSALLKSEPVQSEPVQEE